MNYYFKNPVSLLTYHSLSSKTDLKATYVNAPPTRRNSPLTDHDIVIQNKHFEISNFICNALNISLFRAEFNDFKEKEGVFTESSLHQEWRTGNKIILWTSSEYCYFGFQNYLKYPLTKLKLKKQWQSINLKNQDHVYIYNKAKIDTKFNNISVIDMNKLQTSLKVISDMYSPILIGEAELNCAEESILFLTHYTDDVKSKFFRSYVEKVTEIAIQDGLKILVKRHKYDLFNYSALFDKKILARSNQNLVNYIPVELFFNLKNIKKIIAVPSSSLSFADQSKLNVYMPKKHDEFRKEFLHLEPFLKFIGCKNERI